MRSKGEDGEITKLTHPIQGGVNEAAGGGEVDTWHMLAKTDFL